MSDHISANLAFNLKQLRDARGLTQKELSELAQVPRPTLAHLESGTANPTVGVLLKVSSALGASIEQLVQAPERAAVVHRAQSLPTRKSGGVTVRKLVRDVLPGFAIERIELGPGSRHSPAPAPPGTQRYLTCELGEIELSLPGEPLRVKAGDVLQLRASSAAESCFNRTRRTAVAYSFTVPALG